MMSYDEYHSNSMKFARVYERYRVMGLIDLEWGMYGMVAGNVINGIAIEAARETITPGCSRRVQEDISAELKWLGVNVLFSVWSAQPPQASWVYANAEEVQAALDAGVSSSCVFCCDHWLRGT